MGDGLNHPQFNQLISHQVQAPVAMPWQRLTASNSEELGFPSAVIFPLVTRSWIFVERLLQPAFYEVLVDAFHGRAADLYGIHDLWIGETFIRFEQNHGSLHHPRLRQPE